MNWRFRTFLKTETLLLTALFSLNLTSGCLAQGTAQGTEGKAKPKEELPLDAFQTRTLPLAKKYLAENELQKARNLLETLLELDPKNVEANLTLGEICLKEKTFDRATKLLANATVLSKDPTESLKANAWLKIVPARFTKPKGPDLDHKSRNNVETAQDEREQLRSEEKSVKVLFFTASWLPDASAFKEDLKDSLAKLEVPSDLEAVELTEPKAPRLFSEYSISLLPAIVVLKSDGRFVGGAAGSQASHELKNLVRQAR